MGINFSNVLEISEGISAPYRIASFFVKYLLMKNRDFFFCNSLAIYSINLSSIREICFSCFSASFSSIPM